jgi:phosphatidylinositol-3-phosphatase
VATPSDDDAPHAGRANDCASCGTCLGEDQKYCLSCGARRGPLPPAIAAQLATLLERDRVKKDPPAAEPKPKKEKDSGLLGFVPNPRAAAVAVMGMLAFGVLLGSAISPLARSAGLYSILLEEPEPEAIEPEAPPAEAEPELEPEEAPLTAEASTVPIPEVPAEVPDEAAAPPELPPELPESEELPEVKHLFLIVLGENGYEESFGETASAPYLAKTLAEKGEVLANYYGVAGSDLANQVALISGQGPTPETALNCPNYADVVPGTVSPDGQVEGNGCIYPASTETLPAQLAAKQLRWRAYVEDIGNNPEQAPTCRHPAPGTPDPNQAPIPGDAYLTWRNPFVYFHALIDGTECGENVVGFDRLTEALNGKASRAPAFSYIVPNACHSGGSVPCEPGRPIGPAATEEFLKTVVPAILASAAYEDGGLIAITSALAPQSGEHADPGACCVVPEYINLPPPAAPAEPAGGPVKPAGGGGRVGMLLISPFVKPGSVNETGYYNHFTLLLTIEELLGLEKLGYAGDLALAPFDAGVFNAEVSEAPE